MSPELLPFASNRFSLDEKMAGWAKGVVEGKKRGDGFCKPRGSGISGGGDGEVGHGEQG